MASMDTTGADENIGERVDIIVWTLVALSGAALALRIWCKCSKQRGLWWDDSFLMVAWAFLLACAIIGSYNGTIGFGRHIFVVDPANFPALGLNSNIASTFSVLGAVWSKTSCALTMLRLVQGSVAKSCIWFIIVSMNAAMFCIVIFTWIRCTPPDKLEHCMDANVYMSYSIFAGSYSAAMDFILALLPWPLIWGLQMKKTEKIGVSLVMSLGVFAGVTAVMKCVALPSLANGDFTYNSAQIVIWGNAEVATTIMAASIPVLRVLVVSVKTSTERYYGTGSKQTHSTGLQSRYNTTITSNRERNGCQLHANFSRNKDAAGDDRSDKSILNGNSPRTGEIVQTNEIVLEYSERGAHEESEGWYEMTDGVTGKSRQDSRCQGP